MLNFYNMKDYCYNFLILIAINSNLGHCSEVTYKIEKIDREVAEAFPDPTEWGQTTRDAGDISQLSIDKDGAPEVGPVVYGSSEMFRNELGQDTDDEIRKLRENFWKKHQTPQHKPQQTDSKAKNVDNIKERKSVAKRECYGGELGVNIKDNTNKLKEEFYKLRDCQKNDNKKFEKHITNWGPNGHEINAEEKHITNWEPNGHEINAEEKHITNWGPNGHEINAEEKHITNWEHNGHEINAEEKHITNWGPNGHEINAEEKYITNWGPNGHEINLKNNNLLKQHWNRDNFQIGNQYWNGEKNEHGNNMPNQHWNKQKENKETNSEAKHKIKNTNEIAQIQINLKELINEHVNKDQELRYDYNGKIKGSYRHYERLMGIELQETTNAYQKIDIKGPHALNAEQIKLLKLSDQRRVKSRRSEESKRKYRRKRSARNKSSSYNFMDVDGRFRDIDEAERSRNEYADEEMRNTKKFWIHDDGRQPKTAKKIRPRPTLIYNRVPKEPLDYGSYDKSEFWREMTATVIDGTLPAKFYEDIPQPKLPSTEEAYQELRENFTTSECFRYPDISRLRDTREKKFIRKYRKKEYPDLDDD